MLKIKKIFSTFVGVAMAANAFITMPISAFADEETSHTYTYDGYEVSYDVTNAWGNTEVVSVTLSNTGDSTIENWMLYFEPNGQVHSTVNVQEAQTSTGTTYFRNSGYNANINPDSSVSFCYMVDDCEAVPDNFTLCQTREEKESGYEVSLKVNQTWGDSFNGEIIIQNNTDKPIESWELTVDTNFTITEITNSWAATVKELEPYSYMLKGTYTGTVYPNSSVSLGFNGVKSGEPTITDYSLTEVVADEDLITTVKDCFKNTDLDSDEDGLSDCIELKIGTDPFNVDSDNDGLSDGDEVKIYGTNPLNPDTDMDGLDDGDEGYNGTFYKNYGIYFDPFSPDTDGNGVLDGDELIDQTVDKSISTADGFITGISISSEINNNFESQLEVNSAVISDPLAAETVGLICDPISISVPEKISCEGESDITLQLNPQSLDEVNTDNILMLWHDEESDQLYELETYYNADNYSVKALVPNIESSFLLVDADIWHNVYKSSNVFDSSVYKIINDTGLTWAKSKEYCEDLGGHLVTISSQTEQTYLLGLMSQYGKNNTYWLGYRYVDSYEGVEPHWESINGEGMPYTNWAPGEPNAYYNEAVSHMYNIVPTIALGLGAKRGQWNDTLDEQDFNPEYSYINSGIICEFDSTVDTDKDGIPDIIETAGMVTKNGKIIYTDPNDSDTDKDGIPDGQEMIMQCKTDKRTAYLNPGQEYLFDDPTNYTTMSNGKIKGEISFVYFEYNSDPTVPDVPESSKLTISGVSNIPNITEGKAVSISGLITSNYDITSVQVGVYDKESGGKAYTSASYNPNKKSYNISALDSKILFNKIPGGNTCYFRVIAKDSSGNVQTLVNQKFIVSSLSNLTIKDVTKIPNINEGKAVSISGTITSNYNITSVIVGVYSTKDGTVAYTSKAATPNKKSYNISALDNYILFNKVPGESNGAKRYFRVIASDSSGNTKTLVNQEFIVTATSSSTNKNIEKVLSNIKNSSNISQYGNEKIDTCVATAKVMLESGFDPKFVAGMLGNICYEGNVGLFEYYNSSQDYMQYMQNHYSYKSNYSGKYIYNVNLNNVYNMLKQINDTSRGTWRINGSRAGFGLGSIQWTFGRTYELVKIYREVNGQNSTITKAQATKAEGLMISRELDSDSYRYIYNNWKGSQSSAYNAAYKICVSYEVPANKDYQGKQRGNLAEKIYSDMMK